MALNFSGNKAVNPLMTQIPPTAEESLAVESPVAEASWTYMGLLQNLAFYPTLLYNVALNKLLTSSWSWFNRIDENVILGALPFKNMIPELTSEETIGGIVCLNLPHEVEHSWVAKKEDWNEAGVSYYWLPVPDFVHAPKASDILAAVEFIKSVAKDGKTVYVHCKAGRTRSATVVTCYLMEKHGWDVQTAFAHVKSKRPQVLLRQAHWQALEDFSKLTPRQPKAPK